MSEIDTSLVPPELAKGGLLRASANQAFSCPITLLPEGEHVWSWFQAAETTHQAAEGLCKAGLFLPNQPSPRRRTLLELVSGCGDHPPNSRDHGARGSQDPPWPMRRNGLSETWTTIAFLSKEALGLRLVPRAQFRFRECSFPKCGFSRV